MDRVLTGLAWKTCLYYLDDIIVFSSTWEEHLSRLEEVFQRLRQAQLKLSPEKCVFTDNEVSYLGHKISPEGILPDPGLLKAIREIPVPTTPTEVRSFLGLAGYYCRFVKNFSSLASPLHALTHKDSPFHWTPECQDAYETLKKHLTTSPITAFPDFSLPFRLYTDASQLGLGAILAQTQNGRERIISCASRTLTQTEKLYPATKLECLAIVWAVDKFRHYLTAVKFEVITDHYALQWLRTMKTGSVLLHRWSASLKAFDFDVKHRPGRSQAHVDALSRLPVDPPSPPSIPLHLVTLGTEDEARQAAIRLHEFSHLGGENLWRLFKDCYTFHGGQKI